MKIGAAGQAYRLLQTFESIPQDQNDPGNEAAISPSIWRLSGQHIQDDIEVDVQDGQRVITLSHQAFGYAEPLLAEIEGVRGRYFSKRLHHAVVRFATNGGKNRDALERILNERFGVSVRVPDYVELTHSTTDEDAGRFTEFKNEELVALVSMFEEFPRGMHVTPRFELPGAASGRYVAPPVPGCSRRCVDRVGLYRVHGKSVQRWRICQYPSADHP